MTFTPVSSTPLYGGTQHIFRFENGYGASVVQHVYSYGGLNGSWELAVLDENGDLAYDTGITDDVIGWLDWADVEVILAQIEALDPDAEPDPAPTASLTNGNFKVIDDRVNKAIAALWDVTDSSVSRETRKSAILDLVRTITQSMEELS